LGSKIIAYRTLHGLKQDEFAKSSGVSLPTIARFERNERKSHPKTIEKILKFLEAIPPVSS
jgi:transcriptional regulator with XRE-family HTH domain